MNLQDAIDHVAATYPFTVEHYPELAGKTSEEAFTFAVRHNTLHIAKELGRMSAVCEAMDHGEPIDRAALEKATVKMFINVLEGVKLQGLDADSLLKLLPKYM